MATIIDVAKKAGVSFKTVSRVLNGEDNVRPATRKKVLAAVEALDYKINSAARALRTKDPRLIALVFNNASRAYGTDLQLGAMIGCRDAGIGLFVHTQTDRKSLEALAKRGDVMGFLIGAPQADDETVVEILSTEDKPLVRIATEQSMDRSFNISVDEKAAAEDATNHLIKLGHERIALLCGPESSSSAQLRKEGFLEAMLNANLPIKEDWLEHGTFDFESGMRIGTDYLDRENKPTAIFACNDDMAAGVIAAAYRLNLRLPEDLSIVGFDDSPIATVVYPPLTTIRQTTQGMAEQGVKLIADRHKNLMETNTASFRADHELIIRGSTCFKSET